ncbi:MAG: hypothetical protein HY081_00855 [Gammaproteobacteria bacterium]|nr:hypothetical protein [Gammaproteobacteria bacterium]
MTLKKIGRLLNWVSLTVSALLITACASTTVTETTPPQLPVENVLIVTGAGMVPSAKNDPRYESMWLQTANTFAKGLRDAIEHSGKKAQLNIRPDQSSGLAEYVATLLATGKQDALLQVTVSHVKNSSENTIYLEASFMPLGAKRYSDGRRQATTHAGPTKRYALLSTTGKDMREASLSELAEKFVKELRAQGFL